MELDYIISTRRAAQIFKKTERQIRRWCTDGKLKSKQLDPDDPKSPWIIYLPPDQYPSE